MCDEKKYTYRDIVMAKREGFVTGQELACWRDPATEEAALRNAEVTAKRRYPLQVERPRVVKDPHNHEPHWGKPREWMCKDGQLYSRTIGTMPGSHLAFPWTNTAQIPPTRARVELWADLLARPTELVDAE